MPFTSRSKGQVSPGNTRRYFSALCAILLFAPIAVLSTSAHAGAQGATPFTAISFGSAWSYLDDGTNQNTAWRSAGFDDSSWSVGNGEFGYGDGGETTEISYGGNASNKHVTTYFRRNFVLPAGVQTAQIDVVRDDGVAIHVNGVEVGRDNLQATYNYQTNAQSAISGSNESTPITFTVDPGLLESGSNVIAVEMHQYNGSSSDISFDLKFTGTAADYEDDEAPTRPSGLTSTARTSSSISLAWNASTDNIGVQSYRVYRDGTFVGSVVSPGTTYVDGGLESETSYSYQVVARDFLGNESAASGTTSVSTTVNTSLDLSDVADATWQTDGKVHAIVPIGQTVYLGGEFSELNDGKGNAVGRNNLAAIDRVTGLPTPFNPNINGKVFALETSTDGSTLYVGGSFTAAGGVTRKKLAAFDVGTGDLTSFDPASPNNSVRAVGTDGNRLFIGGLFQEVGGQRRIRLAAYDLATEELDAAWTPEANDGVKAMVVDPGKVWVAGNFDRINGAAADGFGAVNKTNGNKLSTDDPGLEVLDLAAAGNQIFLAGGGSGGTGFAYNRTTGREQWRVRSDGNFQGVAVLGEYVYFGGHWDDYYDPSGTIFTWGLSRHNVQTGAVDRDWFPKLNGVRGVNAIAGEGSTVYVGGDFSHVTNIKHKGFAAFTDQSPNTTAAQLMSLTMLDEDQNGVIDTVKAEFDRDLAFCTAPCTGGWILSGIPSEGSLRKVKAEGSTATLQIDEGSAGFDTSVGDFTVRLAPWAKIKDASGAQPSFPVSSPVDGAPPIPLSVRKTNIGTGGLAEPGDAFKIEWSEPVDPASLPTVTELAVIDPADGGNDQLTVAGIVEGSIDLGATDYLECPGGPCANPQQAAFRYSQVTLNTSGLVSTVTLSSCAGNCGRLTPGTRSTMSIEVSGDVTDLAGNPAVGTTQKSLKLF